MMKQILLLCCAFWLSLWAQAQPSYFPPLIGSNWETTSPSALGWCQSRIDSLYQFLDSKNSKAFILLIDGRIVLEQYFDGHTVNTPWYWASAGKTLTAFMTGIAQQEGYLSVDDPSAMYLGPGWTSCTPEQEAAITVWHQLTMTTGLDDGVADATCYAPECLQYLAEPGTRWAYHNGPYTILDQVIAGATGMTLNDYTTQKLKVPTGMTGSFIALENNNVFFSNARSMARFGLLTLNNGNWNGNQIMTDSNFFQGMVNTSQDLNQAYGYLWWLNGKPSFMVPGLQLQFPGSVMPSAPADCVMGLGANGQFLNVVPSGNMVWVRMGNAPDNLLVDFMLNDMIWQYINQLECEIGVVEPESDPLMAFPNPFRHGFQLSGVGPKARLTMTDAAMRVVWEGLATDTDDLAWLSSGVYFLRIDERGQSRWLRVVKE